MTGYDVMTSQISQSRIYSRKNCNQNDVSLFSSRIRRDFFICWITLPADLKNWDLKKKKNTQKGFCLTPLQNCSFLASSEITEKMIISKLHSALANYVGITINGSMSFFSFFLSDCRSDKFQLMQQCISKIMLPVKTYHHACFA